ncbi:MAG: hypothetical protein V9E87_02190 [Gemmatimonadales bacterium]
MATGRFGKPAFSSSGVMTQSTHSGGLSQASRSSLRRRAAAAMLAATISPARHGGEAWPAVGRGVARRQAGGEGEGFEGGGRGVARIVAYAERGAEAQRPEFVEAGMQDAEGGVVGAGDNDQILVRQIREACSQTKTRCLATSGVTM